jgi:diguanylate cyclase (GGDEF)-like protein
MMHRVGGWFVALRAWLRRRASLVPALAGGLLAVGVVGTNALSVRQGHHHALQEAGREIGNIALVLADHTERALQAVEVVQDGIIERMHGEGVTTPEILRGWAGGRHIHEMLRDRANALPQLDALTIIDAEGRLLNFSRSWPGAEANASDRDYFQALRAGQDRFLSRPAPDRGTGTPTIYLARRISAPDGSFMGTVLGAIELAYFDRLFGRLALGPHSNILFLRSDGVVLMRYPGDARWTGQDLGETEAFREVVRLPEGTTARIVSPFDGDRRLVTARALENYPIRIHAGITEDAALAAWRREALRLVFGTAVMILILGVAVLLIVRQLRAQEAAAQQEVEHQRALALQHAGFRAAVEGMAQGVWMFDAENRLALTNFRCGRVIGFPSASLVQGAPFSELAAAARRAGEGTARAVGRLAELVEARRAGAFVEDLPGGRAASITYAPLADGGWIATFEDVSERRRTEARMAHMARHDDLTGLPNRAALQEQLARTLLEARRNDGRFAVLYMDLDRFKQVNDTLGHGAGDAVLHEAAVRLSRGVRLRGGGDMLARLGGDEFCIVTAPVPRGPDVAEDAEVLARRLTDMMAEPFEVEGQMLTVGASIGVALWPSDGVSAEALLKNADLALYRAKHEGRGRHRFFERAMDEQAQRRRVIETELRRALAEPGAPEFELHYQPVLRVASGQVTGFEALVRWRHPERGLVPPGEFVPLAEELGLITRLGALVLHQACAEAMGWPGHLRVAVNLSPLQFRDGAVVETVARALADTGLAPERLELEITEGVLLERTEANLQVLHRLRALGVRIAMDDFGTGYSSLGYLRSFPFDKVKVDRSFIQDLATRESDVAIMQAVIGLSGRLHMTSTAEGVETAEQLLLLRREGCEEVQGYLISPPVPAYAVPDLLERLSRDGIQGRRPAVAA